MTVCYLGEGCPAWEYCKGDRPEGKSCSDILYEYFKSQGKLVFRSGRSNMVVEETEYEGYQALKIEVHGAPDSGLYDVDEVVLIGARGGCYDILLNDLPLYSVFDDVGKEHEVVVHLRELYRKLSTELALGDNEFKKQKFEEAKYLIQRLAEIIYTCLSKENEKIKNSVMLQALLRLNEVIRNERC